MYRVSSLLGAVVRSRGVVCHRSRDVISRCNLHRGATSYGADRSLWRWGGAAISAAVVAGMAFKLAEARRLPHLVAECSMKTQEGRGGRERSDLPSFTREEISQHKTPSGGGVWVTYRDGVYDITDFILQHPGGPDKVMLAAGGEVDPYWEVFAQHNSEQVLEMLEEYRIGNISQADRRRHIDKKEGPYANDPPRSPILKVNTLEPFNAETPPLLLPENFITPNELFFVRNHLPVPDVDSAKFEIEIEGGEGLSPIKLTLDDLKTKFPQHTVTSTIQCAGNRREELGKVKEVKGISWTGGAIGNSKWTGVRLRDVLLYSGLKEEEGEGEGEAHHVHFEGLDRNPLTGQCYGASIPIEKAMDPRGDCLLVHSMNGTDLPRDHGYPVRVLVPGTVGARNVKWLTKIVVSHDEYDGQWQQRDYKGFSPSVDWSNVDFTKAPAIQEMPVQSLICSPQQGSTISAGDESVSVKGIAWSGGGRGIVRVDVSVDGGKSWVEAELKEDGKHQKRGRAWAWTSWEVSLPLPLSPHDHHQQQLEVCCKAVDDSYNVQPDTTAPIWNLRGCLSNAWHRVNVKQ